MAISTDNPVNPMDLGEITCDGNTVNRKYRSFMIEFEDTSEFEVYFATDGLCLPLKTRGRKIVTILIFANASKREALVEEEGILTSKGSFEEGYRRLSTSRSAHLCLSLVQMEP